ncbi:hypothetical protein [Caldanaerobacter subterraneus]|nr:hypothetical protein [Caldanaerobacter subterraneus]
MNVSNKSDFMEKWYNLLCNTPEREKEFLEKFYKEDKWLLGPLGDYRKYQMQQGRGRDITAEDLILATTKEELMNLLEEIFLYPIEEYELIYISKFLKSYDYLLKLHNAYPDYPAIKLVLWEKQGLI